MGVYDNTLIAKTLAHTTFEIDEGPYVLAGIPLDQYRAALEIIAKIADQSYVELIRDETEVSIIATQRIWHDHFGPNFSNTEMLAPLAKVFCKVPPEHPTCTGYLLAILGELSPNNIGVYVQGAFTTDHIFIHSEDTTQARSLFVKLQSTMKAIAETSEGKK